QIEAVEGCAADVLDACVDVIEGTKGEQAQAAPGGEVVAHQALVVPVPELVAADRRNDQPRVRVATADDGRTATSVEGSFHQRTAIEQPDGCLAAELATGLDQLR